MDVQYAILSEMIHLEFLCPSPVKRITYANIQHDAFVPIRSKIKDYKKLGLLPKIKMFIR